MSQDLAPPEMPVPATGLLRHIYNLNRWHRDNFRPLLLAGQQVGYLKDSMCQALMQWPGVFSISRSQVEITLGTDDILERSRVLDDIVQQLVAQGVVKNYLGEPYPVTDRRGRAAVHAILDRGAAAYFGIRTFGQHLNGYVMDDDGVRIWVARRAADRLHFPGRLDNIVAGGLPHHLGLEQNLVKECWEEAAIPDQLVKKARAVGVVSYCRETDIGLKPDTLYCYDLELPESFQPRNTDGEVADFRLLPVEEAVELVRNSDEFKPNCNLVFMDFFIRHGLIGADDSHYLEIIDGLHSGR